MITARPYIEPTKDKVADYKRICERHEAIVYVRFQAPTGRIYVKRIWVTLYGTGESQYQMMPLGDKSFGFPGRFTISVADWKKLVERSLNETKCSAKAPIHEWKEEKQPGPPTFHDMPVAQMGDVLTLIQPVQFDPLTVLVRTKQGQRFIMFYQQLLCPLDVPITTPNGS